MKERSLQLTKSATITAVGANGVPGEWIAISGAAPGRWLLDSQPLATDSRLNISSRPIRLSVH